MHTMGICKQTANVEEENDIFTLLLYKKVNK